MRTIEEIINFITKDLNIKISEKKKNIIINKFYDNYKDKIYWSINIDGRCMSFFYEGIVSKKDYEKIKLLPSDTYILFASPAKYVDFECNLSEITFTEDENKIKEIYNKGGEKNTSFFDLMDYFYEYEKIKYDENDLN
jgi:hypothetical protein